ncbi:AfsA-related hotdog domain-containing protein [Dickeya ananatis]|uniref:AfsA-related hotdog domain-containing protein n=1 Tax=Dickeya ananatis TaxID=3061286 RepID=UPI003890EACD
MNNEVSFHHTLDKELCHKDNVHEVFLTDCLYSDQENLYYLGAVKPQNHSYYGEENHDEIFLFECCRQSMLCVSHQFFDVPFEHKFILSNLELSSLNHNVVNLKNIFLKVFTSQQQYDKSGVLVAQHFFVIASDGNHDIFHSEMFVKYIKETTYNKIRKSNVNYDDCAFPNLQQSDRVFLNGLGIENDKNILVSDFEETKNGVKTRLNVNLSNTSLLEHRHDHFSAVVLIDAVIQSSICYLSKNYHGSRWRLKSLKSKYNRFVEIVGFTSIDISKYRGVNFSDEIRIEAKIIQFGEISSEFSVIFKSDNY